MLKNLNLKFDYLDNQISKINLNSSGLNLYTFLFHLIVSIILFSPLFIGRFQMAGTDQYFNIFFSAFFYLYLKPKFNKTALFLRCCYV